MRIRTHPGQRTLSLYVDGQLTEERRVRVDEHLEECLRCQRETSFMFEVQRGLRRITKPRPPRDVLERVIERREAGERIILPSVSPDPRRLHPALSAVTAIAATVLLVAIALLVLPNGRAAAGASGMFFSPDNLDLKQQIEVEYRTAGALAGESVLELRGRYLSADEEIRSGEGGTFFSTELRKDEDQEGVFRGTVELPGSAVYAHFAVEDERGEYVDHNGHLFWDLMARYDDDRPKFEALWQRSRVFEQRDRLEAYESVRSLTKLYPERVEGWAQRYAFEMNAVGSVLSNELVALHKKKFDGFLQSARPGTLSASELGELVLYARRLNERGAAELWARELEKLDPNHPSAVRVHVERHLEALSEEPRSLLTELEREFERVGPIHPRLLQAGYRAALATGDPSTIRQWSDRLLTLVPGRTRPVTRQLAEIPALQGYARNLIRIELDRLDEAPEFDRPLHLSVSEYREANRRVRHDLLVMLGRMLVADGQLEAGVDTLTLATESGWDPALFGDLASYAIARGDTATSLRFHAWAAVDPIHGEEYLAAHAPEIDRLADDSRWQWTLETATAMLRGRVRASEISRTLLDEVVLRDGRGVSSSLSSLLGEDATIVVIWSRLDPRSVNVLAELTTYREELAADGIEILAITRETPSDQMASFLEVESIGLPVYFDRRGEATAALKSFALPDLLILDGGGRIRFQPEDVEEAVRATLTGTQG
jgi:hypothetical protein